MKTRFLVVLALVAILCISFAPEAKAQTANLSVYVANPSTTSPTAKPEYPADPPAFNTTGVSYSNTNVSQTVTALTGRKQITFDVASGASNVIYVAIGTTTAVVGKYCVIDASAGAKSRTFTVDDTIPVSYISNASVPVSIVQEGFRSIAKR